MVDCESKLNNTLSHEICHIAAWAIDKEMKPPHGSAFKHWGRKIMKVRKDISVTTKHTYEIGELLHDFFLRPIRQCKDRLAKS